MNTTIINEYNILYLIQNKKHRIIKIGVTNNIKKRLKLIQNISGMKLNLLKFYITQYSFNIEKLLHNKFKNKRTYGEWFYLNKNDIEEIDTIVNTINSNPSIIINEKLEQDLLPIKQLILNFLEKLPELDKINNLTEMLNHFEETRQFYINKLKEDSNG